MENPNCPQCNSEMQMVFAYAATEGNKPNYWRCGCGCWTPAMNIEEAHRTPPAQVDTFGGSASAGPAVNPFAESLRMRPEKRAEE